MKYTVNKLSKLSGVSISAIRFYDEIGLLKPTCRGENGYRYYEQEQLFLLQQILFFRELGFQLSDIQKIIGSNDFDKVAALGSHKRVLLQNIKRTKELVNTINKTILYLKGKTTMKNEELYYGFNSEKQASYEKYLIDISKVSPDVIYESKEKIKNWKKADWDRCHSEGDKLNKEFAVAIENDLDPASETVQQLVKRHYEWIKNFWTPTKHTYIGLSNLYSEHEDFKKFYERYNSHMIEFLVKAIKIFAEENLS
ncbi:MAG: Transcriptional regulator SkgA, mercury resistance [Burkholderiales bacterium]|nr:Transcriptional regulator SkgA, mercury resistance [Burkholderiales bacterium]